MAYTFTPPPKRKHDPFGYVPQAMDFAREGVNAFGEQLRPGLEKQIGDALGGLNSIGALRSGGTNVALNDITTNYANQVGTYAKQAASDAIGYGLQARQLRDAWSEQQAAKHGGLLKAIGSVLGAGVGFLVGGPGGAAAGANILPAPSLDPNLRRGVYAQGPVP